MADFAKLLEPLSSDSPTGKDLRYTVGDPTFATINGLRTEALAQEEEGKPANWAAVVRECSDALATKSKDLELAAWLAEGLARSEGFPGVRDGLDLVTELLRTFWEGLHPGYEEGEIFLPIRARPIAWLGLGSPKCFLRAVKEIPILTGHPGRALSWHDYEMSQLVDDAKTKSDQSQYQELAQRYVDGDAWNLALEQSPAEQLEVILGHVRDCAAELESLAKTCQERFGEDEAPSLLEFDELLGQIRARLERRLQKDEASPEGEASTATAKGMTATAVSGPIATRQDALRQLVQVAVFFRQTEPHSPISYLVERAVRWGNMPLEELFKEVVKSPDALEHIWDTLGIRPPEQGNG